MDEYKVITKPFFPEGIVEANSEDEAKEKAVKKYGDIVVDVIRLMR